MIEKRKDEVSFDESSLLENVNVKMPFDTDMQIKSQNKNQGRRNSQETN